MLYVTSVTFEAFQPPMPIRVIVYLVLAPGPTLSDSTATLASPSEKIPEDSTQSVVIFLLVEP